MNNYLSKIYSGKKVFLTGHTGFKGSWLAFILNQLGATVKGYSLAPTQSQNLFNLIKVASFSQSILADIQDKQKLEKEILNFKPDFIFHLAAQSLVIRSYEDPVGTYQTNVIGTVNILECVRKLDNPCQVLIVTTDKVYENIEQEYAYKENDCLGGYDPYSSSKAACEIATASYRLSFFNPVKYALHEKSVASARSGNVIGGGDWSENRIIPDLIRSIDKGESLEIRNPNSIRPWQHLLDPLSGYLLLAAKMLEDPLKYASAFNFGPMGDINLSVEELVKKAINVFGKGDYFYSDMLSEKHEAALLHLDITKAQSLLGWEPKLNADQAINLTMEWYRDYKLDPFNITFKQINNYFNL